MKILLATDGSRHSEKAVETAALFGFPARSEIKIITVAETPLPANLDIYGGGFVPPTAELEIIAHDNALQVLENTKQKLQKKFLEGNVVITTEVLFGTPESKIVQTAEKMNADLIIVGSHGYNTWERLLLGSVSDSVVHHAPCSVLVVRSPKE